METKISILNHRWYTHRKENIDVSILSNNIDVKGPPPLRYLHCPTVWRCLKMIRLPFDFGSGIVRYQCLSVLWLHGCESNAEGAECCCRVNK